MPWILITLPASLQDFSFFSTSSLFLEIGQTQSGHPVVSRSPALEADFSTAVLLNPAVDQSDHLDCMFEFSGEYRYFPLVGVTNLDSLHDVFVSKVQANLWKRGNSLMFYPHHRDMYSNGVCQRVSCGGNFPNPTAKFCIIRLSIQNHRLYFEVNDQFRTKRGYLSVELSSSAPLRVALDWNHTGNIAL